MQSQGGLLGGFRDCRVPMQHALHPLCTHPLRHLRTLVILFDDNEP